MGTITPARGNTSEFFATIGDDDKVISTRLKDENGFKNLTGATVKFNAWKQGANSITITGDATVDNDQDANRGLVSFTLTSTILDGDPVTAGVYECEWQVTIGESTVTFPDPGKDLLYIQDQVG